MVKNKNLIKVSVLLILLISTMGLVSASNPEQSNSISTNDDLNNQNLISNDDFNKIIKDNENVYYSSTEGNSYLLGANEHNIYVNNTTSGSGSGTLDDPYHNITDAVNSISTGSSDDYIINIAPGTYHEHGIILNNNITFTKWDDTIGEVIISGDSNQIFSTPTVPETSEDKTVYNINLYYLTLINATTTTNGAVLNISKYGNVKVINCIFKNNNATGDDSTGGVIYIGTGNLTVTGSDFIKNNASYGGVIDIDYGNVTVYGSNFTNNSGYMGSVISIYVEGNVTVNNSNFTNNNASGTGAITIQIGNVTVNDSDFINNTVTDGYGGAINIAEGNFNVSNSDFINNTVTSENIDAGGAIFLSEGKGIVTNSSFISNKGAYGGAICIFENNLTIINSSFINNKGVYGGAICIVSGNGNCNVTNSVFLNNSALTYGMCIFGNLTNVNGNWWGNNTPFNENNKLIYNITENIDEELKGKYINPANHVILKLNINPISIETTKTSMVNLAFFNNETNTVVSIPNRVLSLNCIGGSFNPISTNISSSVNSIFTAGQNIGNYIINATVDNETLTDTITIIENPLPPVNPTGTILIGENITTSNNSVNFTVTLKTVDGNVLSNESVLYILYNDEYHPVTTDNNGVATITLNNLTVGTYNIRYVYFGNNLYASSNGVSTIKISNASKSDSDLKVDFKNNILNFNLTSNGIALNGENITVVINGTNLTITTNKDGLASIDLNNYTSGIYTVSYYYLGTEDINGVNGSLNIIITNTSDVITVLTLNNFTEFYGEGLNLTGKLLDLNGNPVIGQHISLNLSNPRNGLSKIYWATTDVNGEYQLQINLFAGDYGACASFNGDIINNTTYLASGPVNASIFVNKTSTILTADKFNETYNAGCNFTGKLVDFNGKPIIGEHISLNLTNPRNGLSKIYWVTTDTMGEYQLAINLFAGEYLACCSYFGSEEYLSSNASTTISVIS